MLVFLYNFIVFYTIVMLEVQIINILILAVILALSIGLHEYAHARASNALGDPTPKLQGRLTPNPLAHIDPIGFLLIFIIHFGRWKPVQINPHYYKNPQKDELLVALAGPLSNILIALLWCVFLRGSSWATQNVGSSLVWVKRFIVFWTQFVYLNIWLALFNLLPLPPLDGRKIVKFFIRDAAIQLEYTLASNPYYLLIIFYILSIFWLFNFISAWTREIGWWIITFGAYSW